MGWVSRSDLPLLNATMKTLYQAEVLHMEDIANAINKKGKFNILQGGKINPTARQSVHPCCTWSGGHIKWRKCSALCIDPHHACPFALPFPVGIVGLAYRRILLCGTFYFSVQNSHRGSQRPRYHCTHVLQNQLLPATTPWTFFFFPVASQPWRKTCIFAFLEQNKENALMLENRTQYQSVPVFFPLLTANDEESCTNHWKKSLK